MELPVRVLRLLMNAPNVEVDKPWGTAGDAKRLSRVHAEVEEEESDVKDESTAYLEFLNEEVSSS